MLFLSASGQVCDPAGNLFLLSNYDGGIVTINVDVNIPDLVIGISTYEPVQVTITGPFAGNVTQVLYAGMNSSQNNNHCGQGNFTSSITGVDPGIVTINPPMQPPQVGYTPAHGNGTSPNWGGVVIGASGQCDTLFNTGGVNTPDELVFHFEDQTTSSLYAHQTQYGCWLNSVVNLSAGGNCCIDATPPPPPSANVCNTSGNLVIYSNYQGGVLTINVDQDIPDLRVGICTYEAVTVNFTGPFVGNITEVIYAGFDGTNGPCASNPPTTTITGVPAGIVTVYSQTLGNIAIANFLGEPLGPGLPPLVNCIAGAEGECSASNSGGGNSAPQIAQFFLAEFGPGTALFAHQVQYDCFSGIFNVSDGGNCCLTGTGTPPNPIYAGNATFDFIPWTDSLLCAGPITIDLSFYPVLFQPPTYPGYVWSDGTTGPVITITEPGTYSFIVGDYCHYANGNWLTDTVVVLPCCSISGVDASVTPISCGGAGDGAITVTPLATGPFTYSWNTTPAQSSPTITGLDGGTYTVTVSDAADCDTTLTFVLSEPAVLSVQVEGTTPLCANAEATATALASGGTGPFDIAWNTGTSGPGITYSFSGSGQLVATVTDANGCSAADSLQVVVEQAPGSAFTASADTACAGSLITFTALSGNADSLAWTLGSGGTNDAPVVSALYNTPGTEVITLVAFGPNGCASAATSDTLQVAPQPELLLLAEPIACERALRVQLAVSDADNCALWLNGAPVGSTCAGNLTMPVADEGDYDLVLTASNTAGCADTLAATVTVSDTPGLFVPNVFSPNGDRINDRFIPGTPPQDGTALLRIFNRWGQELFTTNDLANGWDGTANGEAVPEGVYVYLLRATDPCSPNSPVELRGHVTVLR
jgi:gliding motility-associated-like protein